MNHSSILLRLILIIDETISDSWVFSEQIRYKSERFTWNNCEESFYLRRDQQKVSVEK